MAQLYNRFHLVLLAGLLLMPGIVRAQGSLWTKLAVPVISPLPSLYSTYFFTRDSGFVCGGRGSVAALYFTASGGSTWTSVTLPGTPTVINDITFPSNGNFGVMVGDGAYVAVSTNRGVSWTQRSVPISTWPAGGDIKGVYFKDAQTGFVVGQASGAGSGPRFARTTNGGQSWTDISQANPPANNLWAIDFFDAQRGVAVGTGTLTRKSATQDGGATWESNGNMGAFDGVSISMYGIDAIAGSSIGFAAGGKNYPPGLYPEVRKTTDFGATWLKTSLNGSSGHTAVATDVCALSDRSVFVAARGGTVYRTSDGGTSWTRETLPTAVGSADLWKIFTGDSALYAVGESGVVLRYMTVPDIQLPAIASSYSLCRNSMITRVDTIRNVGTATLRIDSIRFGPVSPDVTITVAYPDMISPAGFGLLRTQIEVKSGAGAASHNLNYWIHSNDEHYRGFDTVRQVQLSLSISSMPLGLTINPSVNRNAGKLRVGSGFNTRLTMVGVIQNMSGCDVVIDSVRLARGTDFSLVPVTPGGISTGQSRTVSVDFEPVRTCERYDTVLVYYNMAGSPLRIPVVGTGVEPSYATSPRDTLDFGGVLTGTSANQTLKLLNNLSSTCLDTTTLFSFRIDGPNRNEFTTGFSIPSGTLRIAPNVEVPVPITATPAATGRRIAYAIVTHEIPGLSPDTVVLLVNGLRAEVTTVRSEVLFPLTEVFGRSDQTLTDFLQNLGNTDVRITDASIIGADRAYFRLNSPGTTFSLPQGAKQTFSLSFLPDAPRRFTATLRLTTDLPDGRVIDVSLVGNGQWGQIGSRSALVVFRPTAVNTCGDTPVKKFIYNPGPVPLRIRSAWIGSDPGGEPNDSLAFTLVRPTFPPVTVVPPGDSLEISLRFCPKRSGVHQARLYLVSNTSDSIYGVTLIGNGQASRFTLVDTIRFAATRVLTERDSVVRDLIFNDQNGVLDIYNITITGADSRAFTHTLPTTPFSVGAKRDTALTIRFNPKRRGFHIAFLTVSSSLGDRSIVLTGHGAYPFLEITPDDPQNLRVRIGSSRRLAINVVNSGDDTSHLESANITGDPAFTNVSVSSLPVRLDPGDTATLFVDFTPGRLCDHSAQVFVRGEGISGIYAPADTLVSFAGIGVAPLVTSRRPEISFGPRPLSAPYDSTLNDFIGNTDFAGAISLACLFDTRIDSMIITGPAASDYLIRNPIDPRQEQPLPSGSLQPLMLRFQPSVPGLREAELLVYFDDAPDSILRIRLLGSGAALPIEYGPVKNMIQVDFGNVRLGRYRDSLFTATNVSDDPLTIDTLIVADPSFSLLSPTTFPLVMQPGVPVEIRVRFSPRDILGIKRTTVKFRSGAVIDSSFGLIGNGVLGALARKDSVIDFGLRPAGTPIDTAVIILNLPTASVPELSFLDSATIDNVRIVAGGASFQVLSAPSGVRANGTDSIMVRFLPSGAFGRRDGVLRVIHDTWTDLGGTVQRDSFDVRLTGVVAGDLQQLTATLGPDQAGRPGNLVRFPIVLSGDVAAAEFDSLDLRLAFRNTVLKPTRIITRLPGMTGEIVLPNEPPSVNMRPLLRLAAPTGMTADTIAEVEFMVLLGDALSTSIRFDSIAAPNRPDISVAGDTAEFAIDGFCDAEGRLVRFGLRPFVRSVPNPATSGTVLVEYTLPAIAEVRLTIHDAAGLEIARIADGMMKPGYYMATFDVSALTAGSYYCVLTAGRFSSTVSLQIVK